MHHFEGTGETCGHCGTGPNNPVHHSQNGEGDYRIRLLAEKDARIASLTTELDAAKAEVERLMAGIREFKKRHEDLNSHEFWASISHLPANCQWSEKSKKEAEAWIVLEQLIVEKGGPDV